jgi:hypothetical protein
MRRILGLLFVSLLGPWGGRSADAADFISSRPGDPTAAFPLRVSANQRYLVDQNNVPFFIAGDSPQNMFLALSEAEADSFMANRQTVGFNTLWLMVITLYPNAVTYDGIPPFTVLGDLSTPNEAYFARADNMIRLAASHRQLVILDPIDTANWLEVLRNNGLSKARDYGRYLGNRYRDFDNILWMSGNDFVWWRDPNDDALVQEVALGIKDVDSRHIHTIGLDPPSSGSLDDPAWAPIISLNASYTYTPTYAQVLHDYNRANFIPTFMVEANYEFENNTGEELGTPQVLRLQEYRAQLSGAAGQLYGNGYTWGFATDWQSFLDTPGSAQFGYFINLFSTRRWYDLIPDQTHNLVIAGYGTFVDLGTNLASDYLTAAITPDGALALAYMPSLRTITVDMTRMSGPTAARWYDPASGTFQSIAGSPFPNVGTHDFSPPGPNSAGDGDWALLLELSTDFSGRSQRSATATVPGAPK